MCDAPWLTIVGLGEDGPAGLGSASLAALEAAEVVIGPPRHLALLPGYGQERIAWPVPFADGLTLLAGYRGRRVVALVSGDPFWFGAGRSIAALLDPAEWRALPAPSTFSLVAARLGWPLEDTICIGLHAAPLEWLRPVLSPGRRAIVLLRDGVAVTALARFLSDAKFGATTMHVMQALGGVHERVSRHIAAEIGEDAAFAHPVAVALEIAGVGVVVPLASGLADEFFASDGQITKSPVRALALSALAPRAGELLLDIGGGSGSISVEWCLAHPSMRAICIERRGDRAKHIQTNATKFGLDRLKLIEGEAPAALDGLEPPDAVFIGGGLSPELLSTLVERSRPGTRLVAHAVTLQSEALLAEASARMGGDLLRIELSRATSLGSGRGWTASYPVVQWKVTL